MVVGGGFWFQSIVFIEVLILVCSRSGKFGLSLEIRDAAEANEVYGEDELYEGKKGLGGWRR